MWHAVLQQMSEGGTRSTVLRPLQVVFGLLLLAVTSGGVAGAPELLMHALLGCLGVTFVSFIAAYIYFAFTDKDALRSERYSIQKMAIQKGLIGDSSSGLFAPDPVPIVQPMAVTAPPQIEDGRP